MPVLRPTVRRAVRKAGRWQTRNISRLYILNRASAFWTMATRLAAARNALCTLSSRAFREFKYSLRIFILISMPGIILYTRLILPNLMPLYNHPKDASLFPWDILNYVTRVFIDEGCWRQSGICWGATWGRRRSYGREIIGTTKLIASRLSHV